MSEPRRKHLREIRACEECRHQKQKCTKGKPCFLCKKHNRPCKYASSKFRLAEMAPGYMELKTATLRKQSIDGNGSHLAHSGHRTDNSGAGSVTLKPEDVDDWRIFGRNDHRAAPQNLLPLWPTLRSLSEAASVTHDDGFFMGAEDRDVLPSRTWGEFLQPGGASSPVIGNETTGDGTKSALYGDDSMEASGEVSLDPATIENLYDSYMRNFHITHPFLDKPHLRHILDRFTRKYSTGSPWHGERPERSPSNCMVYLILAVGQISLYHESLLWTVNRGNMDAAPGLAYYAKAAEIIGDHCDGNELIHVQMFLLAGLYQSQLARVKESMSWITMAGRAILTLLERYNLRNTEYWNGLDDVRARLEAGQQRIKDREQSLIVLASWCCLQLERDILADMKLPGSGIQQIEGQLCLPSQPKNQADSYNALMPDEDSECILFYNAHLWLQRIRSEVRQIYGPDHHNRSHSRLQEMQRLDFMLISWRSCLPEGLTWHDDDPPPSGILAARLQATYWDVLYLIHRPFVDYALNIMPSIAVGSTVKSVARDGHGNPRDEGDVQLFEALEQLDGSEIWRASERCVDAAMKSVAAFHNVPGRLIVTNIHGTAHAQFGNMLVLIAVFASDHLKPLLPEAEFHRLLQCTIAFLRRLSPTSPTSLIDCEILEKFSRSIFHLRQVDYSDLASPTRSEESSKVSTSPSRHTCSPVGITSLSTPTDYSRSVDSSSGRGLQTNFRNVKRGKVARKGKRKACDRCFVWSAKCVGMPCFHCIAHDKACTYDRQTIKGGLGLMCRWSGCNNPYLCPGTMRRHVSGHILKTCSAEDGTHLEGYRCQWSKCGWSGKTPGSLWGHMDDHSLERSGVQTEPLSQSPSPGA